MGFSLLLLPILMQLVLWKLVSAFILKLELIITKLYQLDVLNLAQCFGFDFFGVILRELYIVLKETSLVKVEIGQIS